MWVQIVGKIRLALIPLVNHWWNVPLYVNTRDLTTSPIPYGNTPGLTTSPIPYGNTPFELSVDFFDHQLVLHTSDGSRKAIPLTAMSVADFYKEVMKMLTSNGIDVKIWRMPVEVTDPIAFDEDRVHGSYDPKKAQQFWRILLNVECVFAEFRSKFIGKCSPIHFFWGSFDLAVTRFSGRPAPERPGADRHIRTRLAASDSGRGAVTSTGLRFTRTRLPSHLHSVTGSFVLRRHSTIPSFASSS